MDEKPSLPVVGCDATLELLCKIVRLDSESLRLTYLTSKFSA